MTSAELLASESLKALRSKASRRPRSLSESAAAS
jgi:hypothetical protein